MIRRLAAALAALSILLIVAAPVAAGGWAEVRPDAATTTEPPIEGQPIDIGFTVLQHGKTPAGWVTPTVHVTDFTTGETIDIAASAAGVTGHFVASWTPKRAGFWTWTVDFPELGSQAVPTTLAVYTATGVAPAFDPALAFSAIDRATQDVRNEILDTVYPEIERIDSALSLQRAVNDRLTSQVNAITDERDALAARLAEVEDGATTAPTTLVEIVLLAVLAGAAAGFAMSWLGGRPGPRQVEVGLSPAPQGSTRA